MKKIFSLLFACLMVTSLMAWDNLYIVGAGTKQSGWDFERAPMVPLSEIEFEYSGYFYATNEGDGFKIATSTDENNWYCYHPNSTGHVVITRGASYSTTDDGTDDRKFQIAEAGFYTFRINTQTNTLTVSNSDKPKYLIPVGDCCESGWNNHSTQRLVETSEGSGKYIGTMTLTPANGHWMKFLCQPLFTAHVGPMSDNDGDHDISGVGVFDTKTYTSDDHKFYALDGAAGTYNVTVDMVNNKVYFVPEQITVNAQITKEAVAALGSVKCFAWTGIGSEAKDMELVDGFYTATFSTYMPLNFLIYNGRFKNEDGGVQSVDMTHDGNGYFEDKCVNLISRRTSNNELMCFHNDDCALNTNSYTVNIYVEDAGWSDVYFFTQNVGDQNEYQNVFTHAVKGDDNWYSYTFDKVENMKWVATATTANFDTQVDDIDNINADKYFYVTPDKHDKYNKIVSLSGKEELKEYTFSFKFDGAARSSWGEENPVGLYYWQAYAMDGEEVADHAITIQMTKNSEDVYTATVKALNHVKFCVQSDLEHGYQGEGHYTIQVEAAEQATGFAEDKMFWIRDNGTCHYVDLTENYDPRTTTVKLNDDGFASIYMDYDFILPEGVAAYSGKLVGDEIKLHEVAQENLPRETGLILYSATHIGETITITECLEGASAVGDNAFIGTLNGTTESGIYVLGHTAEPYSTAFYYMADDITIPANRAYLKVQGGSGAPLRMRFVTNVTTDMEECQVHSTKCIIDGRLYILRDGKKYTVTGQVEY